MRTFYIYVSVAGWVWTLGVGIFLYLRLRGPASKDRRQGSVGAAGEAVAVGVENRHE